MHPPIHDVDSNLENLVTLRDNQFTRVSPTQKNLLNTTCNTVYNDHMTK